MKFKEAYEYAMANSEDFRRFDKMVKDAQQKEIQSPCKCFTAGADEVFYYGFDGAELQKGKHTPKRAAILLNRDEVMIIG